jgi:hypothetical protein
VYQRSFSIQRVLDIAIKAEEKGMQVYEKLAEKFSNKLKWRKHFRYLLAMSKSTYLSL